MSNVATRFCLLVFSLLHTLHEMVGCSRGHRSSRSPQSSQNRSVPTSAIVLPCTQVVERWHEEVGSRWICHRAIFISPMICREGFPMSEGCRWLLSSEARAMCRSRCLQACKLDFLWALHLSCVSTTLLLSIQLHCYWSQQWLNASKKSN